METVPAQSMMLQIIKRWQQVDNATHNLETFYKENREGLTHADLVKLHERMDEVFERLMPVYEEVGKMLGKKGKSKYVKEIDLRGFKNGES